VTFRSTSLTWPSLIKSTDPESETVPDGGIVRFGVLLMKSLRVKIGIADTSY
jgi:hypothetical protein